MRGVGGEDGEEAEILEIPLLAMDDGALVERWGAYADAEDDGDLPPFQCHDGDE